jgi:hypothetical protein
MMRQVWAMMRIKCMFCSTFQGSPFDVEQHERWSCEKRTISTLQACCSSYIGTIEQVMEHVLNCPRVLVSCLGCNYPTHLSPIEKHDCEGVKKQISMLRPDFQEIIQKGKPGQFGHVFAWSIEEILTRKDPSFAYAVTWENFTPPASPPIPPTILTTPTTPALSSPAALSTPSDAHIQAVLMRSPSTSAMNTPNAIAENNNNDEDDDDNEIFDYGVDAEYLRLAQLAGHFRQRRRMFEF